MVNADQRPEQPLPAIVIPQLCDSSDTNTGYHRSLDELAFVQTISKRKKGWVAFRIEDAHVKNCEINLNPVFCSSLVCEHLDDHLFVSRVQIAWTQR
jgi:hypothetical protein